MFDVNNDARLAPKLQAIPQETRQKGANAERINPEITSPRLRKMIQDDLDSGRFMTGDELIHKLEWLEDYLKEKFRQQNAVSDSRRECSVG